MRTHRRDATSMVDARRRARRTGRVIAAAVGVTVAVAACAGAQPDDEPTQPAEQPPTDSASESPLAGVDEVRIIVPTAPGGGFDIEARILAPHLQQVLERSSGRAVRVYVENVPGGEARVGAQQVYESDAVDILYYSTPILINGQLDDGERATYHVENFQALGAWVSGGRAAIKRIDLDLPANDLDGLSQRSAELPILWGHEGLEPDSRLIALLLAEEGVGLQQDFVYHDGSGDAIASLLRGDTEVLYTTTATLAKQVEANADELEFLAQMSCEPDASAPEVPTVVELGWPNADQICASQSAPRAFLAPPGMDSSLAKTLSDALMETLASQAFVDEATGADRPLGPMGPQMVNELISARLTLFTDYPELIQD